jgi:hypothetical protein
LLSGSYKSNPVRKVEISKPGGGKRTLGIPTVIDRMIQQALSQALTPIFDPTFSEDSYGFRLDGVRIKRYCGRRNTSRQVIDGWWTWIWKRSSIP